MIFRALWLALLLTASTASAHAETSRDILMSAAFSASSKAVAVARVEQAIAAADAAIKAGPGDPDARLQRALAISYRGKLNRSRGDLEVARQGFEAAVAADPRNAEAYMVLAGWHLGGVIELGPMLARTMLGARKATGLAEMNRAVALGGNRAAILALASLHLIQIDPADVAGARRLAEQALTADANTPFDRLLQRHAEILLASLRKGDGKAAAAAAKVLMPFGRVK